MKAKGILVEVKQQKNRIQFLTERKEILQKQLSDMETLENNDQMINVLKSTVS